MQGATQSQSSTNLPLLISLYNLSIIIQQNTLSVNQTFAICILIALLKVGFHMSRYYLFDHFKVNYNVPLSAYHTPSPHILDNDSVVLFHFFLRIQPLRRSLINLQNSFFIEKNKKQQKSELICCM